MIAMRENVRIELTWEQANELESLLWECCTETDEGVKTLREDLSLSDIWRTVADAIPRASRSK
jgi:hypothetical protein